MSATSGECTRQEGDKEKEETQASAQPGRNEYHHPFAGDEAAAGAAVACADCVAVFLGTAATLSFGILQAGALLVDVCWRAIRKSCCDSGVSDRQPRYYVPSNRVAYVYEEPVRVYFPRAPSGYYSGSTNTFIPGTPYP